MRVGVIGISGFGQHHAKALSDIGWEVAAVAAAGPEVAEWAERYGATPYRDFSALVDHPALDAVTVALPPRLHPEAVRAALRRGLPVFCEKPVAPDEAGARALLEEFGPRARVAVGFCFRYHPAYRRLRDLIASGDLGRVRSLHARKCWGTRTSWRLGQGGGAVFVKDIHYYDLIPWLLGEQPDDLCAYGGAFYHDAPVEDSYQLLMRFPSSAVFHLDSAWWNLPQGASHFEVVTEAARIEVREDRLVIHGEESREEEVSGEAMLPAEMRAFSQWLAGGEPLPGLHEAWQANALAERVVQALGGRR